MIIKRNKKPNGGKKMIDDFMSVLENFSNANLYSEGARKRVAEALVDYMCEKHI